MQDAALSASTTQLSAPTTPQKPLRSSMRHKTPRISPSSSKVQDPSFTLALSSTATSTFPAIGMGTQTPNNGKGKRKAEDVDVTPPEQKTAHRATFAVPADASLHPPSAYPYRKRARLSSPPPNPSRSDSTASHMDAHNTGTFSSRTSRRGSTRSNADHNVDYSHERRRSLSQISIPLSALVAPHAPSLSHNSAYHMRDPHRPPRKLETPWSLRLRAEDADGSPVHAWLFYIAFIIFPLWWIAAVWRIPRTRRLDLEGSTQGELEKAVMIDDPQIEFDARSWRFRCRIMAVVSLFTYIPFIVLVAVFASR